MNLELEQLATANALPAAWDKLAGEYYQTREFLLHAERYNPCRQRYYLAWQDGVLQAGMVVYTLVLDMFTYSFIRLPLSMNIAGISCSVSASGFIGDPALLADMFALVKPREKGFLILLNLDSPVNLPQTVCGPTLPTLVMNAGYASWQDYTYSLRASYRRRLAIIEKAWQGVTAIKGSCSGFSPEMYGQYMSVLSRTKGKLETLPYEFFRNLPGNFTLTTYYHGERLLGWHITASWQAKLYFFLGGFDYQVHAGFHSYFNLLGNILQEAIAGRFPHLELGQTAETPKLRLGGELRHKWMAGYHSNWFIRLMLHALRGMLAYKENFPPAHPFKEPQ